MRPEVWHITDDNKVTLCGEPITWGWNDMKPVHPDQWCQACQDLDG